ncbi:MAG TPA: hypothetical protein VGN57_13905 [Pirellulaceae bacterium]|jgi:uncharacterized repeat protein (TIGR01451 family)|nr:hypothetical protein [Pirellulaceae bacterium]
MTRRTITALFAFGVAPCALGVGGILFAQTPNSFYPGQSAPYPGQQAAYPAQQAGYPGQPGAYPVQPAFGSDFVPAANPMYGVQPAAATEDPNQRSSRRTVREGAPPSAFSPVAPAGERSSPTPLSGRVDAAPLPAPGIGPIVPSAGMRGSVESIPLLQPTSPGLGAPTLNPQTSPAALPVGSPRPANATPPSLSTAGPTEKVAALPKETPVRPAPTALLVSPGPQIHVSVEGPETLSINREAVYRVVLENRSEAPAAEMLLRVTLPAWAQIAAVEGDRGQIENAAEDGATQEIRWSLTDIRGSQTATMTCRLVPKKNQPIEFGLDWVQMAPAITKTVAVREPKLELAISGPPEALYGETRRYTIVVSNPGDGEADEVELSLSPLDGSQDAPTSTKIGALPAGGRKEITIEFDATKAGEQSIAAKATGAGGLSATSSVKVLVRRAELAIAASGQPFAYAGAAAAYKFRVTNTGTAVAKDVLAAIALPEGLVYLSGVNGAVAEEGGVRIPIGQLAPGEGRDFTFRCEAKGPGERTVEIGARAEGDVFARQSVATRVEAVADLKLTVNDPAGPLPVGEEVVYEITVSNRGAKAAKDVRVVAQFSDGIEPVSAHGAGSRIEAGQVVFDSLASVGAASEVVLKVTAKAHSPGHHIFRGQVLCAETETRLVAEDSTQFYGEAMTSVPKTAALPSKPFSAPTTGGSRSAPGLSVPGTLGGSSSSAPSAPAPLPKPASQLQPPTQLPSPSDSGFVPAEGPAFGPAAGGEFQPN